MSLSSLVRRNTSPRIHCGTRQVMKQTQPHIHKKNLDMFTARETRTFVLTTTRSVEILEVLRVLCFSPIGSKKWEF